MKRAWQLRPGQHLQLLGGTFKGEVRLLRYDQAFCWLRLPSLSDPQTKTAVAKSSFTSDRFVSQMLANQNMITEWFRELLERCADGLEI